MARTPESITVDVRMLPEIRELLAEVWQAGWNAGRDAHAKWSGNPYQTEDEDGNG